MGGCLVMASRPARIAAHGLGAGYSFLVLGAGATAGVLGAIWLGRSSLAGPAVDDG